LLGLQYNVPFADAWRFNLRGDVGGFGVGSDLIYQLLTNVRWQANDRVGVVFGYRRISFDYEEGDKGHSNYQHYALTEQGPLVGMTIDFLGVHPNPLPLARERGQRISRASGSVSAPLAPARST
jgi:hypothetical protein